MPRSPLLLGTGLLLAACAAPAQDGRWLLTEENDGIVSREDRHYTQGTTLTYLSAPLEERSLGYRSFEVLGVFLPMFRWSQDAQRHIAWQVYGQSQFTPADPQRVPPDSRDRPYAAWLYTGLAWLQEIDGESLHDFEVLAGVVGPAALGRQTQNGFHAIFGFNEAAGWDYQLGNRGAFQFSYGYRHRVPLGASAFRFDLVPSAGVSLGTVMRYVEAGGLLRFGNATSADYGPQRVRPALSGTAYADAGALGPDFLAFNVFVGGQVRRVQYNRFIDGAAEISAEGLSRRPWALDALAGGTVWLSPHLRADFTATRRSREFIGQSSFDVYGAATLSVAW